MSNQERTHASEREPNRSRSRDVSRECATVGCPVPTTGRKPYCIQHLDQLPYVQWLQGQIALRETGAASTQEIVQHLEVHGAVTLRRLAAVVRSPMDHFETFVTELERAGVVKTETLTGPRGRRMRVVKLGPRARDVARAAG